jgi:transposase
VFTGAGRRRTWSADEKARIVAESLTGEESVCAVARRHGLSPQQLFGWRRQLRREAASVEPQAPLFVPAVIEATPPDLRESCVKPRRRRQDGNAVGIIEVEINGVMVRIGGGADVKTIAAALRALQAGT